MAMMANLEDSDSWPQILQLKDSLTLKELSQQFGTTPGAISAALKRTNTSRLPAAMGQLDEALPPEPDEVPDEPSARPGSKDALIQAQAEQLGRVPDAEIARRAGVSVRTVASYRARHNIPGYRGPRKASQSRAPRKSRIDPYADLLGQVPDRVVAEKASVSLNAVRNYRNKLGISAAGRSSGVRPTVVPTPDGSGRLAWRITWRTPSGEENHGVLVASDLVDAAKQATAAEVPGVVIALELAGTLLD